MLNEFKTLLEDCTQDKIFYHLESVQGMFKNIDKTHYFYLPLDLYNEKTVQNKISIDDLDLPFEYCFFEFNPITFLVPISDELRGKLSILAKCPKSEVPLEATFITNSIYAYEEGPKNIKLIASVKMMKFAGHDYTYKWPISFSIQNGKLGLGDSSDILKDLYTELADLISADLANILHLIRHKTWTEVSNEQNVKLKVRDKRNLVKYKYKPSNITYICTKLQAKSILPTAEHHKIINKPNYSYEVMGHWRRLQNIKQLGKDRHGYRNVKGYTWVIPYIKGEGELVKKVRVVK